MKKKMETGVWFLGPWMWISEIFRQIELKVGIWENHKESRSKASKTFFRTALKDSKFLILKNIQDYLILLK